MHNENETLQGADFMPGFQDFRKRTRGKETLIPDLCFTRWVLQFSFSHSNSFSNWVIWKSFIDKLDCPLESTVK